ncbi:DUF6783 domain-containing protein [Robinsoniella peoriensis]
MGIFVRKIRGIAGCADYFPGKFHAQWGTQMTGMNFQTGSAV